MTPVGQTMTASSPSRAAFWTSRLASRFRTVVRPVGVVRVEGQGFVNHLAVRRAAEGVDRAGVDQPPDIIPPRRLQHIARPFHVDAPDERILPGHDRNYACQVIDFVHTAEGGFKAFGVEHVAFDGFHVQSPEWASVLAAPDKRTDFLALFEQFAHQHIANVSGRAGN